MKRWVWTMPARVLCVAAAATLAAAGGAAHAGTLYDDTAGAAVGPGGTPSYQSSSYSGVSLAEEFVATGSGKVTSFSFAFSNASAHADPLTVSLWTTNAANIAFDTQIGSWTFNSGIGADPFTQIVSVTGGPTLTSGVRYGIELATSSTATSTDWLSNSNVIVPKYEVCNVAFYCNDPNGQTPTANSAYFTGTPTIGPEYLFTIDGGLASTVPEPSVWAGLALGLAGIGATARHRRRRLTPGVA